MPDISMCSNQTCPSRKQCYRFMAIESQYRQTYAIFHYDISSGRCDFFWPIEEGTGAIRDENVGSPASELVP